MNAQQAIEWIHNARYTGSKHGLDNMRALLAALGNPQDALKCVHVAGTNGKGSICCMVERGLRNCGLRTGLYTSPFLSKYNERISLCGEPISDVQLAHVAGIIRDEVERLGLEPTSFELGTAIAFCFFAMQKVDAAVIEVGLGGRLDPTNVIRPVVCAVSSISLDHTKLLGDTVEQIAYEKAGIIKPGVPVVLHPQQERVRKVFADVCEQRGGDLYDLSASEMDIVDQDAHGTWFAAQLPVWGRVEAQIKLPGVHQVGNAMVALTLLGLLQPLFELDKECALQGVSSARWPGRLEWIGERALLDGAHNEGGAKALVNFVRQHLQGRPVVLLTAMMSDKAVDKVSGQFAKIADRAVVTRVDEPRAVDAQALAQRYKDLGVEAVVNQNVLSALRQATDLCGEEGVLLVSGSLYLVGAVRPLLMGEDWL